MQYYFMDSESYFASNTIAKFYYLKKLGPTKTPSLPKTSWDR